MLLKQKYMDDCAYRGNGVELYVNHCHSRGSLAELDVHGSKAFLNLECKTTTS